MHPANHDRKMGMRALPPAEIEFRPAGDGDFDAIADLWSQSFRLADGSPEQIPPLDHFRTRIEAEMVSGAWTVTVAVSAGRIVAFLALATGASVLREVFVLPSMQRRGIGARLLEQAMQAFPTGFTLGTAAANRGARRFYEASGLRFIEEYWHPKHRILYCSYGWKVE